MHRQRVLRYGDPHYRQRASVNTVEDFWLKVDKTEQCWLWTSTQYVDGYGSFKWAGKMRRAHRLSYEWIVGPIPDGLELDHLCRNRACVNPAHLEPVTHHENVRRGDLKYVSRRRFGKPLI